MAEEEYKTYQPKWEERKSESEKHHHHHHHNHYVSTSNTHTNSWGGWLKMRDKQAYYGLMLVLIAGMAFGGYMLVKTIVDEFRELPKGDPSQELKVDELGVKKVDEAAALFVGDSLARELKLDSSLIHSVKGVEHNVYRPPRKKTNDLIDGREWNVIFKHFGRWFKANGGDPKFIIAVVAFGLFILSLVGYGIYKHKHKHDKWRY